MILLNGRNAQVVLCLVAVFYCCLVSIIQHHEFLLNPIVKLLCCLILFLEPNDESGANVDASVSY